MAGKPHPDSQAIQNEFQNLRMQNVPIADARKFLAEKYNRTETAVRLLTQPSSVNRGAADPDFKANPDFLTTGTSTLYDAQGQVKLQWVKQNKNYDRQFAEELINTLSEQLPKAKPSIAPKRFETDVIAVYPMGDPHFGMYAWSEEAGEDFDLKIAEANLCDAVDRLVNTVPSCESALIVNLGDFFHADNMEGRTARSGVSLDTDTRWPKVLRVGLKAIDQCIHSALARHKHVTVINAIGNHDDHSAMFLSVALSHKYQDDPRITINHAPTIKHYHRFGKNLFGVHHGHTIKMQDLPLQMAIDRPVDWSECSYRFFFTGHIHHDSAKEIGGVRVESYRTLAAKDAWHASMGYHAGRDMKAILFHKDYGEAERHTVNLERLRLEKA
jgi:hypothetical protein